MSKLLHAQEFEVFYVIPALRRDLAKYMKESGLGQKQIAQRLGVSEAAVSQYFNNKRAQEVEFSKCVQEQIKKASQVITDQFTLVSETQNLLNIIRNEKTVCKMCHKHNVNIPVGCNACFNGG